MAQGNGPRRRGGGWLGWIVLGLAIGAAVLLLDVVPEGQHSRFIYLLVLLVFIGGTLLWRLHRAPLARSLRHGAVWLLIGGVLFVGYSFRDEAAWVLDRVTGDLVPERGYGAGDGEISFRAGRGGHFAVEALVEGVAISFLVDTGATEVVLTKADARRLGLDPEALAYTRSYQTANGTVIGAPLQLDRIAIGPVVVDNVRASVNSAPMEGSLLGMSFLGRIGGYRVAGDVLTLYAP